MALLKPSQKWIEDGAISRPVHIVCSPFKTGTTSVGQALLTLGVGSKMMQHTRGLLPPGQTSLADLQALADAAPGFRAFRDQHGARVRAELAEFLTHIAPYDVFQDAPFGHTRIHPFIRKVLAPQARFIWVNRDRADWIASVQNWEETHPDFYPRHELWKTRPSLRRKQLHKFWRRHYRNFQRVRRSGPDACLELDWSDLSDWSALAAFYGVTPPKDTFPKSNVSRGPMP